MDESRSEAAVMTGDDQYIGWYDRRNRFLDLHLHVRDMQRRAVRTPEMEATRGSEFKKRSHSPLGAVGKSSKAQRKG